jgi:hypothetical protein
MRLFKIKKLEKFITNIYYNYIKNKKKKILFKKYSININKISFKQLNKIIIQIYKTILVYLTLK